MLKYEFATENFKIKGFNVKEGFILFKNDTDEIVAVSSGWTHWDGDTPRALCIYPLRDDGIYVDENNVVLNDWHWKDDDVYPVWDIFQLPEWQVEEDEDYADDYYDNDYDEDEYPQDVYEYMEEKEKEHSGTTSQYHYVTSGKNTSCYDFGERIFEYNELGTIFNFDGFNLPLDKEIKSFIDSVGSEFVEIPNELLDYTTSQNFDCYIARI